MAEHRIVVAGGNFRNLEPEERILGVIGAEVIDANRLERDEVIALARTADALLVDYFVVDAAMIGQLERCRVICRYGVGVDRVDIEAATRAGIPVTRVPEYCVGELADHATALMLALLRRIVWYDASARSGAWVWDSPGLRRLAGLTLGVAGLGRVGSAVVARARPHGFRILAFDPALSEDEIRARGAEPTTLERLIDESDVLSLHAPLTSETRGMIGRDQLAAMRPGAFLVNTARAGLIDQDALVEALRSGRIGGAALDVLATQPPAPDDPILSLPNVVLTPYAGHFSEQSLIQVQTEAAEEVLRALTGERLLNTVNARELEAGMARP